MHSLGNFSQEWPCQDLIPRGVLSLRAPDAPTTGGPTRQSAGAAQVGTSRPVLTEFPGARPRASAPVTIDLSFLPPLHFGPPRHFGPLVSGPLVIPACQSCADGLTRHPTAVSVSGHWRLAALERPNERDPLDHRHDDGTTVASTAAWASSFPPPYEPLSEPLSAFREGRSGAAHWAPEVCVRRVGGDRPLQKCKSRSM